MHAPAPSHLTTLAEKTDDWFRRATAALLNQVPCRAGCAQCCIGLFPITRLDVRRMREGLAHLPADVREGVVARATQQVTALEAAYPRLKSSPSIDGWSDPEIDRAVGAFQNVPCPALTDDGMCSIYASRPLTCRSMGIPTRKDELIDGACDVQTFVPIVRLPASLVAEDEMLATLETNALAALPEATAEGEEVMLPYGFVLGVPEPGAAQAHATSTGTQPREADSPALF